MYNILLQHCMDLRYAWVRRCPILMCMCMCLPIVHIMLYAQMILAHNARALMCGPLANRITPLWRTVGDPTRGMPTSIHEPLPQHPPASCRIADQLRACMHGDGCAPGNSTTLNILYGKAGCAGDLQASIHHPVQHPTYVACCYS